VIVVVIVVGLVQVDRIEYYTDDPGIDLIEDFSDAAQSALGGLTGSNHDQHAVYLHGQNHSISDREHQGAVDNDVIELTFGFYEKSSHGVRAEQFGGAETNRSRWTHVQGGHR